METIKAIPKRSEIAVEDTWATEDLFPSDESWEQALATLQEDRNTLISYAGRLGESGQILFQYLENAERIAAKESLLAEYIMRKADEDTRDAKYQALSGKFMSVYVDLQTAISFETPQIMAIPDETLDAFYTACPELERYRRYLTETRRLKAHTLSDAEERILASAGEMAQAPNTIFDVLSDADMTYPDAIDGKGNHHPLSAGTFVMLEESQDRELRKSAYENL